VSHLPKERKSFFVFGLSIVSLKQYRTNYCRCVKNYFFTCRQFLPLFFFYIICEEVIGVANESNCI